jgi:tetratricopeptide (TPR) repeat protein
MPRARSIPFYVALMLVLLRVDSLAANQPPWQQIKSSHFTVITDAGEKKGREVAFRFEQMRSVFATLLGKDRLNQSVPLNILALKDDKSYYQVAPLRNGQPVDASGFLLPGEDQDFIVLNLPGEEPWRAVAHDFALMLLTYNYPPAQGWFDEGLAEYFSSIRLDDRLVQIGGDPELSPSVSGDLPGNRQNANPAKSLTELLSVQTWMSLPDLFSMKHDASPRNEGTHHTLYYAQSWIVMHYLLHEKKLPETGAYFDLVLNHHVPVEDAIQKAYGMSSAQLEQAVKEYFHSQSKLLEAVEAARKTNSGADPRTDQTYSFPSPIAPGDSSMYLDPISEPEVRALYAEIQIRIPERREMGLKTLNALASTPTSADQKAEQKHEVKRMGEDPEQLPNDSIGLPIAHRILAWDHIQRGEFQEGFTELGDAAALNPRDMWIRYYISIAKYRMAAAKHAEMMGLANMMIDLKSVLEWYPEMAGAYDLLAVARNTGGGPSAAMQSERAAIALSPRNQTYVYHLAEIYVASKKWEAANALLDRLKSSSDPKIAAQARELVEQAGTERKYGIPVAASGSAEPKYAPQKSPFDVLEEDEAKREAEANKTQPEVPGDKRSTKFVKGQLVSIDCSKAPAAVLTVNSASGLLKLHADDYRSILLIGADDFSCEWRNRQVTVNYKPGAGTNGDLVSLEMR